MEELPVGDKAGNPVQIQVFERMVDCYLRLGKLQELCELLEIAISDERTIILHIRSLSFIYLTKTRLGITFSCVCNII